MSRIKHLEIRGVRSFDPNDSQTISFYTPLTIIVGKNGCGKTTLIECLKYATTGEMPPNSKQGAFINDPKLSSSNKVKAQVRLTFYNIKGKRMQVVRGMELTQNKASKTQKTTQSTLMCIDDAKERSLTSTCSELDTEMPLHLGVSKAILENVIFCHQEEASWPLSEPAVLKKKFDDIFAATRYTKALDNIKSLKKDKTGDLKLQENELLHLKSSFVKSAKVKETKNQIHSLMIETELRIAALDGGEIEGVVESMTGYLLLNNEEVNGSKSKISEINV
jgi:DNA repair protein RAD50